MAVRISTVEIADLPRWVELHRAILPEPPSPLEPAYSVEAIAEYLLVNPKQQRLLAEVDGRPAGLARTSSSPNALARGGIYAFVAVAEEFRGRGLGTSLHRRRLRLGGAGRGRGSRPAAVRVGGAGPVVGGAERIRGDRAGATACARAGVRAGFAGRAARGRELTTLAARPNLLRGVYELALEAEPDVPGTEAIELPPFEEWQQSEFGWALRHPEAVFVATTRAEVVGSATLDLRDGGLAVHMGTSVRRAWRGRGLARALKATQIAWAKEAGYSRLETSNDTRNAPILRLNESFGYTERPSVLTLRGPLAPS